MINQMIVQIKKNKRIIFQLLGSIFATIGIVETLELTELQTNLTNQFLNIILFVLFYLLYRNYKKPNKREHIFSAIFSIFVSSILIIGGQLEFQSMIVWNLLTPIKIVLLFFAIYPIISLFVHVIENIKLEQEFKSDNKKLFIWIFIIIFVFNFLVLLAIYPGVYGYDAGFQMLQVLEKDVALTSHYSLLFSFLLAHIVNFGKVVFGSYEIGFSIFCFLQMTFLTYVATKITTFVTKYTKNKFIYLFSILFFSIFPLYTVMVLSSSQDVIFGGIFALIILNLLELVLNSDYYFRNVWSSICLSILIFFLCVFRNNGFYAILVLIPIIILFQKKKKMVVLISVILPLVLFKIYSGPFFDCLGVKKGTAIMEMSSIPSQQIARVYNYNYNVFDKDDLANLNRYYTKLENFEYYLYNPSISDSIKSVLNIDEVENDLTGYVTFWLKLGIKDPKNYIEGFLLNNLGLWYPNKNYYDSRMYHPYIEYEMLDAKKWNPRYIEMTRDSKFPMYEKVLELTLKHNAWKKVPVISTLFTAGSYFMVFAFLFGITIVRKRYNLFVVFAPIIGLYITLFLSPVILFRYCFPIVILLPIFLSLILEKKKKKL